MKAHQAIYESVNNPLDGVEEILMQNDWMYDRSHDDQLIVQVAGQFCNYQMIFNWHEEFSTMQFVCEYDVIIPTARLEKAPQVLAMANEKAWLGHFEVPDKTQTPQFRYTSWFRSHSPNSSTDYIADLFEISMEQCERNYNLFDMLAGSMDINKDILEFALKTTAGEA